METRKVKSANGVITIRAEEPAQAGLFVGRPEHVPVDKFDENGVVEELEPALIVAGKVVVGSAHLVEEMQEQSAAEVAARQDGPRPQSVIRPARGRRAVRESS